MKRLAHILRRIASIIARTFVYRHYDSSAYWKKRAAEPGQAAVLWKNQQYNELYRERQSRLLEPLIASLPAGSHVLDIGCGVGVVSKMILQFRQDLRLDAVDFPEMIAVAEAAHRHPSLTYIPSSAEDYSPGDNVYDMVISSACYSAIRDISKLEKSLQNGARMLKPGGAMVMIDPFHRWNYLARTKYATRDVVRFFAQHGLALEVKGGVLFWPYREWLANSDYSGEPLRSRFARGERLLDGLGQHFWADYKVLVFRKAA